jgi:thiol:disulfide interchange protein DsbG
MKYVVITLLLFTPWAWGQLSPLPEPLKLVTDQGGKVVDHFAAPAEMTGYIIDFKGQVMSVYVTADNKYLFTGLMLDAKGENIGEQALQAYISGPKSQQDWQRLESSHWITDGSPTAKQIIYTFTDPNCPYCKKFWKSARPWVESGQVQLRHILVGIIKADSLGKAAAILATSNPSETLKNYEADTLYPQLQVAANPPAEILNKLQENHQTMIDFGVSATPATFYRDATGTVQRHMGLPQESSLQEMFGPLNNN